MKIMATTTPTLIVWALRTLRGLTTPLENEQAWHALWRIGIKWEWQNSDRYAQKRGDIYHLFAVHNDAAKLDMVVPLPAISAILEIHEYLLDLPTDDHHVDDATNLLRKWMKNYV